MKQTVKGITYDTESAKKLYDCIDATLSNKLSTKHNVLCATRNKEYFLHLFSSNALNKVDTINNMRCEKIVPLTVENAISWGQMWMPETRYREYFMNEDNDTWTKQAISVSLSVKEVKLLNKISNSTGFSVSKLISNAVLAVYDARQ